MASIYQTRSGFRAQVFVNGTRRSKVFRTKREALAWGAALETELRKEKPPEDQHTLGEAFDRYAREVSPGHKGYDKEVIRLQALSRQLPAGRPLAEITTQVLAGWRDARLQSVKGSSVLRDIKLLNAIFEVARREWKWIKTNPLTDVAKPRGERHRTRTVSRQEIRRMLTEMGYSRRRVSSMSEAVAVLWLVALRTGMRAGELCGLTWDRVFDKHCHLPVTKTTARDVPLSRKAKRLIERMRGWDKVSVFNIQVSTLDALFRRYRERAGLEGFTFHDARRTAATWMSRKVDVLMLCKILGWSDPKMAMVYYSPTSAQVADLLDGREPS